MDHPTAPDAEQLSYWLSALAGVGMPQATGAEVGMLGSEAALVDLIRGLEELKGAAAAAQARATIALDAAARSRHARAGLPAAQHGRGVGAQVALARRESPARGGRYLGLARALVHEMPHTMAALACGRLSEWRATLLCRETACLSVEARLEVDREMCADLERLEGVGDRRLAGEARRLAYRLDPGAAVRRARKAVGDRRVTLRPAPDTMAYLTALLPVAQGVACLAALDRAATRGKAEGDTRSQGQLMADLLVERVTGQATATAVPVEIALVVTDRTLLDGDVEPGHVPGYGPVPSGWARDLISNAPDQETTGWLRRLFTRPGDGGLVAIDSARRRFPPGLRRLVELRDGGTCRTPWCDAPIRHLDHVVPHAAAGRTSAENGQGLCEACNHTKQAPGWRAEAGTPRRRPRAHTVRTTTPTGHTYSSQAPPVTRPVAERVAGPVASPVAGTPTDDGERGGEAWAAAQFDLYWRAS